MRTYRLLLLMVLAGIFSPVTLFAQLVDPSLPWRTIFTPHFAIHYDEGEETIATRLAPIAEQAWDDLTTTFDARPWGRTEVVVVDNQDESNGFAQIIPYNHILFRAVPPGPETLLGDYDDWLKTLFTHEFTHIVHLTDTRFPAKLLKPFVGTLMAPNGLSPGWVTEGLATYFETEKTTRGRGRSSYTDMLLRTDILQDRFLKLDQMAGTQFDWPAWQARYLYGVRFFEFLSERYGEKTLTEFSHKYGASLRFFMLNSQAKRVFKKGGQGQSFYRLWKEWKEDLQAQYGEVKKKIEKEGLREGAVFLEPKTGESFELPTFSPDGQSLAYVASSVDHALELRLRTLADGSEKILLKKKDIRQMAFFPDGTKLIVSYVGKYKRYNQYSDLYEIDLATGKSRSLTKGLRARDPDVSPDGKKIVAVLQETGKCVLGVYDPESPDSKEWAKPFEAFQIDHPRWLPDGKSVVASVHDQGRRDLRVIDVVTGRSRVLTADVAIDDRPVVEARHGWIYFSSDRTGISNLYRYDLKRGRAERVTNVLTGAFAPAVSPDGDLLFQYYNGRGFEIRRVPGDALRAASTGASPSPLILRAEDSRRFSASEKSAVAKERTPDSPLLVKNYNPFRKLFIPRYFLPGLAVIDGAVFASGIVSNHDPLERHSWFGEVTYRSDNQFIGYGAGYRYQRYRPQLFGGYNVFAANYGDLFATGADFFEERKRAYGGVSIPLSPQRFTLQYFFEDRSAQSGLPSVLPVGRTPPTLGNYAGILAQYSVGKTDKTAAGISPEEGGRFSANFQLTHDLLGSSNNLEQRVVWADGRTYLRVPGTRHHVLALRAVGGTAFGDQLSQGNFSLGGSLGESPLNGVSTRLFTLRGLPLGSFSLARAWVASAEYRVPLFRVERGLGTMPLVLNSAHFAVFTDVGDAFDRGNPSFRPLLSVGAELRGDFVVGYNIPLMGRLGYGRILTNRNRIAGLVDDLMGWNAKNGVLVLEIGTSF